MSSISIAWGDGTSDSLTISYRNNSGNQIVTISSDPNKGSTARTKTIKITTKSGKEASIIVTQEFTGIGAMIVGSTFIIPENTQEFTGIGSMIVGSTFVIPSDNSIQNLSNYNGGIIADESLGIASGISLEESENNLEKNNVTTKKSSNSFFSMLKRLFS